MSEVFGRHDFGLSEAEEKRAAHLHESSIIIDTLFQGPCGRRSFTSAMVERLKKQYERHRSAMQAVLDAWSMPFRMALDGEFPPLRETWEASGITGASRQTIGFPITPESDPYAQAMEWYSLHQAQFDRFDWLDKALVAEDFRVAKRAGKRVGFLNSQNTLDIGLQLDRLDQFHRFGMRMIQLTYNTVNHVGGGSYDRVDCGVTNFGSKVIDRMNGLGILVDISHCGRQTTLDACKLSKSPVVASHTAAWGLFEHVRNKKDDELRAIADTGGYVGIYCLRQFLTDAKVPSIDAFLDHVDHVCDVVGWEHVGIGSDWPVQQPEWTDRLFATTMGETGADSRGGFDAPRSLVGFDDIRDFPNITRGLVKRGYSDEQIRGILGENFLRVFEAVCG
ncbi:MAG: membrane dipeptidase [Nitratireductor sp.]